LINLQKQVFNGVFFLVLVEALYFSKLHLCNHLIHYGLWNSFRFSL